jgi:hypothetical protein
VMIYLGWIERAPIVGDRVIDQIHGVYKSSDG